MKKISEKNGIIGGLFWSFGERIAAQLVTTIVTIVLARILDPEHYGIISIVTVVITFLNVFVSSGFGSALVQKKDSDTVDFDTAFWMSFSFAIILYTVLFFAAPLISDFYENEQLTWVIRVLGIRLIFASLNNIQQAYVRKKMEFRKFFWATFIGTVVSGGVGIVLALLGYGVWALVFQYLTNVFIDTVILYFVCGWQPKFRFSSTGAKGIWKFGWKVLATELVFTLEGDIRSLIVGKVFGSADLAYFDQGKKYPSLFVNNVDSSIQKVMLPAYSKLQDQKDRLLETLRKSIGIGVYILAPLLIGFAVVANNFVSVILTDKWIECVPFIQIFCILYLTRPFQSSCHQALLAIGKSGLVLITMIVIHSVSLITVIIAVFVLKSVLWIALFSLLTTAVSLVMFFIFSRRHIGYKFGQVIADVLPSVLIVAVMGVAVYFIGYIPINKIVLLALQVLIGGIIYLSLSYMFKPEPFLYLLNKVKSLLKKKNNSPKEVVEKDE